MITPRPVLLILGMPGSGKTTAGRLLSELLGIPHRSVGDVLRAGRASGVHPPLEADPATWFLEEELRRITEPSVRGIVLDFSPVTPEGAGQLSKMLSEQGFEICRVVHVAIRAQVAEERCSSRGQRSGDTLEDMRLLFKQRVAREFRPFTIPMIQDAARRKMLLTLENSSDETEFKKNIAHLADLLRKIFPDG